MHFHQILNSFGTLDHSSLGISSVQIDHPLTMRMFLSPSNRIDDINIAELPPFYKIERFYIPSQSDIYFEPRTISNKTLNAKAIFNGTKCGVPKEHCFSILIFLWRHYDVITWIRPAQKETLNCELALDKVYTWEYRSIPRSFIPRFKRECLRFFEKHCKARSSIFNQSRWEI